tara:strand:+ start:1881 stop:2522 length:642 start_codon:yes stop_codon:yes gene_type:complete
VIKVAFLFDKSNPWIFKKFKNNKNLFKKKIKYKFFFKYKKIKKYDLVVVLGNTKILPRKFVKDNQVFVTHGSFLPEYRGFAPIQRQILDKKKIVGMTLFKASPKLDSGPIVFQKKIKFSGLELYEEIREKQYLAQLGILEKLFSRYPKIKYKKQPEKKGKIFKKRKPEDQKLDINKSIKEQFNLLRISNNNLWPAFFNYKKKKFIIKIYKNDK